MRRFQTLEEYAEFFAKIPAKKWCTGEYKNAHGQMCAIGLLNDGGGDLFEAAQDDEFRRMLKFGYANSAGVNNGDYENGSSFTELGASPKERILNALTLKIAGVWDELAAIQPERE